MLISWVDLLKGLSIISSVLLLFYTGYRLLQKNNNTLALLCLLFIGFGLRWYLAREGELHHWDEKYHALVAKHLIDDPLKPTLYQHPVLPYDQQNWVGNHIWLAKPPVALWGMALWIKILGNTVWAVRIMSFIYGMLAILLTWSIAKKFFNIRTAYYAAFLHAIHGVLVELIAGRTSSDHVEIALLFYVELAVWIAVYLYQKKNKILITALVGIVAGLAFLSKWYPAGIIFPLWLLVLYFHFPKMKFRFYFTHSLIITCTFLSVAGFWILYIAQHYPTEFMLIKDKFLGAYSTAVENHSGPWYYYLQEMLILYGELIYFVLALIFFLIYKKTDQLKLSILLTWICIPLLIFSFGETKRFTYLLLSAPACFILIAYAADYLLLKLKDYQLKGRIVISILVFALFALPFRFSTERIKPFEDLSSNDTDFYNDVSSFQNKYKAGDIISGTPYYIELMYFTDVTAAYAFELDSTEILSLQKRGFSIIHWQD
ncbi:MAG: glycosyltransferase family 39 protein [Crocinitomicaceae bacterium]|nr:glycosyltransferase family 39 protein [Crocinitomicaceae bacterium]MBK8927624.1 glycosyltransferase family 39 protein [Crocinitomicaceae bacterium]